MNPINHILTLFNRNCKVEMDIFDFEIYMNELKHKVQLVYSSSTGVAFIQSHVNPRTGVVVAKRRFLSSASFYQMYRHRQPHVQLA